MRAMNLKPALQYQLDYMAKATLSVLGVSIAIILFFSLLGGVFQFGGTSGNEYETADTILNLQVRGTELDYGGNLVMWFNLGAIALFSIFIVGIVGIREDIKFLLQHGMGRYTVFLSTLLGSLITGLALGALGELLNFISSNWEAFPIRGLTFDGAEHGFVVGWLSQAMLLFFVWQLGTLISLIYYRMNRIQQIVFSVCAGGIIFFGIQGPLPALEHWGEYIPQVIETLENIVLNPVNIVIFSSAAGVVSAMLNFFLIRRAEIKE